MVFHDVSARDIQFKDKQFTRGKVMDKFNRAMNDFATDRSLETCLDALNLAMQLANIRGKLAESYEFYARLLEKEITKLNREKT